jgi:hypothetical protein
MPDRATTSPSEDGPVHTHEWQAHGLVRVNKESCSPCCSRWDDVLYQAVYAVQSCSCGKVKRTHVANENQRRRGDDLRRGQR